MADMRLVVAGAGGRMGRTLVNAIADTKGVTLAGAFEQKGSPAVGRDSGELAGIGRNAIAVGDDLAALLARADGLIDFTVPAATVAFSAFTSGKVHIIGTTGLSADDDKRIEAAAAKSTIVKSGNMSLGVNLLAALVKRVSRSLDESFDIEIFEMHHNKKIDAPSGTALLLGKAAAEGRGVDFDARKVLSREGHTGARKPGDIGFAVLRGGSAVGEHKVYFASGAERIELAHQAMDRSLFANGALKAARWAHGRKPGLYSMMDVLGLTDF
jgi:4-hydroxy-tetrahydrodipicolinate reductase